MAQPEIRTAAVGACSPIDWSAALPSEQAAIHRVLDKVSVEKAVHFCFGNDGGHAIQRGLWESLVDFLNGLHADHVVLELAHRPGNNLRALKHIGDHIDIGAVDIKVNHVETPDEIAIRIDKAVRGLARFCFVCALPLGRQSRAPRPSCRTRLAA